MASPQPHAGDEARTGRLRLVLMRLARRLRQQSPPGVTPAQLSVLSLLSGLGPQPIRSLAEMEGVRQPTMSRVVATLEANGWVRRGSDPRDGRAVVVHMTRKAEREMTALRAQRDASLESDLASLSPSDRRLIRSALPALERLLEVGDAKAR